MVDILVKRATKTTRLVNLSTPGSWLDQVNNLDVDMDVLLLLSQENVQVSRLVMNLMRQLACQAQAEQASLLNKMCALQDDNVRLKEEREAEAAKFEWEKQLLEKRASDSNATCNDLRVFSPSHTF